MDDPCVTVAVRLRPPTGSETRRPCVTVAGSREVVARDPADRTPGIGETRNRDSGFEFDRAYGIRRGD